MKTNYVASSPRSEDMQGQYTIKVDFCPYTLADKAQQEEVRRFARSVREKRQFERGLKAK